MFLKRFSIFATLVLGGILATSVLATTTFSSNTPAAAPSGKKDGVATPGISDAYPKTLPATGSEPSAAAQDANTAPQISSPPITTPKPTNSSAQASLKNPILPPKENTVNITPPPSTTVQINEQFTGSSLDSNLWEVITYPKGYRNNEEQDYRPSQVQVADGTLRLIADRDVNGEWHSGEVHSKWNYLYGEFEVRMALSATGPGVWPAAWLMGTTDQWPNGGEIDIAENINGTPTIYGTIHAGGSSGHWQLQKSFSPVVITQFNTYKIIKQPGLISWWVNGNKYGEWQQSDTPSGSVWPFENHRNFGLLNLAIGGNWPGPSNASTPSTVTMYVDYFTVKNGS